jgi:excisionase family DNA binding protein
MHEHTRESKKQSVKLSVREAAALLNESERAVWMKVYRRQIPHRRWGKKVVILRDELEAFLHALPGVTAEQAAEKVAEQVA